MTNQLHAHGYSHAIAARSLALQSEVRPGGGPAYQCSYNTSRVHVVVHLTDQDFHQHPTLTNETKRLGAEQQPTLVRLPAAPASHISSERAEKKHSTVCTCVGPQGCVLINFGR